ncbi:PEP-CTERM protein-sorting domain-containing protein [Parasphingorhabdus marina DSM 22363]|uniref:PEP-CTERM protein-sorting domain-containing protein n=1 Tax=Parasphingorhabdus marina DSM 22363 TaxID=1123272 RepID=A0A1N6H9B6_9SPHN|nr:PEPxxWA-CTERM sorting domain-containing protein [Parasphingorhabdus marina]SIO16340.1 PEP-CTERM protein-sorting domain-containing protein [Parasphingorhabdus marina DSM 22363]
MSRFLKTALITAMALPASAQAATVMDTQAQTSAGQLFTYSFGGLEPATGPGTITITARGDYSTPFPDIEFLEYDIEGLLTGALAPVGADSFTRFSFNDVEFTAVFDLSLADLNGLLSDNVIELSLDLSGPVNIFDADSFTSVMIDYPSSSPTPEPASWAMMIGGFGLVGGAMRRSRKRRLRFSADPSA